MAGSPDLKPEDVVSKLGATSAQSSTENADDWYSVLKEEGQEAETMEERENKGILDMRKYWSTWVLIFIGVIVMFDVILVFMYGTGRWSFTDPTVVIVVITDNFLKIFGLGFLITREIFKKIYH